MDETTEEDYVLIHHPNHPTPPDPSSDYLTCISAYIDSYKSKLRDLSLTIHDDPELNYKEYHAYNALVRFFEELQGWKIVHHAYGIETAFIAIFENPRAKIEEGGTRVVSFNVEYDALPGIGHACGHNLIAIASVSAAMATKHVMQTHDMPGKVIVYGTPAEEGGGGKIKLLNAGAYNDHHVSVSLISHPGITPDAALVSTSAYQAFRIEYFGKEAHAAAAPWQGINALDALIIAYTSISVLRQQLAQGDIIQCCITHGGAKPNIIHAHASADFVIRAPCQKRLQSLKEKVERCFQGAAMATGAKMTLTPQSTYLNHIPNRALAKNYTSHFLALGGGISKPGEVQATQASTDQGDVSHAIPSISVGFCIDSAGEDGGQGGGPHTPDFTRASRTVEAHEKALRVGKALAATAVDVLTVKGLLDEIRKGFERDVGEA